MTLIYEINNEYTSTHIPLLILDLKVTAGSNKDSNTYRSVLETVIMTKCTFFFVLFFFHGEKETQMWEVRKRYSNMIWILSHSFDN